MNKDIKKLLKQLETTDNLKDKENLVIEFTNSLTDFNPNTVYEVLGEPIGYENGYNKYVFGYSRLGTRDDKQSMTKDIGYWTYNSLLRKTNLKSVPKHNEFKIYVKDEYIKDYQKGKRSWKTLLKDIKKFENEFLQDEYLISLVENTILNKASYSFITADLLRLKYINLTVAYPKYENIIKLQNEFDKYINNKNLKFNYPFSDFYLKMLYSLKDKYLDEYIDISFKYNIKFKDYEDFENFRFIISCKDAYPKPKNFDTWYNKNLTDVQTYYENRRLSPNERMRILNW